MLISIVVSVFNEEQIIETFYYELRKINLNSLAREISCEIIFVDDGSNDRSLEILSDLSRKDPQVTIISLSRNYGHEAAMIAGIDYSSGDAVICMDADLQHPPFKIREMVNKYLEGYEVINMVRRESIDAGILKNISSKLFYYFLNKISLVEFIPNASDFFLISRRVADILKTEFRERIRFLRGLIQVIGFNKTAIEYVAPIRAGGKSKYSLVKLFALSLSAISTFSNLPLHLGIIVGTIIGLFSLSVGIFSIIMRIIGHVPPGYTTIVVLVSFLFAVQLFIIGIIGEYLSRIFDESKKRPIYLIDKTVSCNKK